MLLPNCFCSKFFISPRRICFYFLSTIFVVNFIGNLLKPLSCKNTYKSRSINNDRKLAYTYFPPFNIIKRNKLKNFPFGLNLVNKTDFESLDGYVILREIQTENCGQRNICGICLVRMNDKTGVVCLDKDGRNKIYQLFTKVNVVSKAICRSVHMTFKPMHDILNEKYYKFDKFPSTFTSSTTINQDSINSEVFDRLILSHLLEAHPKKASEEICRVPLFVKCDTENITYFPPLKILISHVLFKLYRPGKGEYHLCGPMHLVDKASSYWKSARRNNSKMRNHRITMGKCAEKCFKDHNCVAFGFFLLKYRSICQLTSLQCKKMEKKKKVLTYLRPGQNLYIRTSIRCISKFEEDNIYLENYYKPSYCYVILKQKYNKDEAERQCFKRGMALLRVTEDDEYLPNKLKTFFPIEGERIWVSIVKIKDGFYWKNLHENKSKWLRVKSKFYPLDNLYDDCNSALIKYNKNYLIVDHERMNCNEKLTTICYKPKDGWEMSKNYNWLIENLNKKPKLPFIGDNNYSVQFKFVSVYFNLFITFFSLSHFLH